MENVDYKSWRDFKKVKKEIAERLPYVPYGNFHFGNTKRHRIYRPHPLEKGVTVVYAVLENGKEYTEYTDEFESYGNNNSNVSCNVGL